ncbi:MAG: hypothetical protein ABI199_02010 [Bacteroidia bacterium]
MAKKNYFSCLKYNFQIYLLKAKNLFVSATYQFNRLRSATHKADASASRLRGMIRTPIKFTVLLICLFVCVFRYGYSQDKQNKSYTVALFERYGYNLLYQKVLKINYDSIKPLLCRLVTSYDKKSNLESKKNSVVEIISGNNFPNDTIQSTDLTHYYYAYIGDTIIKHPIKLNSRYYKYLEPPFSYTYSDSSFNQKVMFDSLLSGKWVQYCELKNHLSIGTEKAVKNNRIDGEFIKYDNGYFMSIEMFDDGVSQEYYDFNDTIPYNVLKTFNIASSSSFNKEVDVAFENGKIKNIRKHNNDFHIKNDLIIDFENDKIKDIKKSNNVPYLIFDDNGKVIGGSLFNQ